MKKLYKIFALVMMCGMMLVGCDGLIQNTYRNLNTVPTQYSAWQFFREMEVSYESMLDNFNNAENKETDAYKALYENFDNRENVFRLLRDSVAVLDLFYEIQNLAFYSYDNLVSYTAKTDLSVAPNGYSITYGEKLDWNKTLQGDPEIDFVMSNLILPTTVEIIISTITSSQESGIEDGYALILRQRATFPQNYADIEALMPANRTENGNSVTFDLTLTQDSTNYVVTASKTTRNSSNEIVYSYSRQIKIETRSNIKYLTNEVTFSDGSKQAKVYRLDKETRNINIAFDPIKGKLAWYINYSEPGQIIISGEAYYQGKNKYFMKEQVRVVNSNPSAYNFTQTFITEMLIDGNIYKYKYLPGEYVYEPIANQNVLKFAVYNNEPSAITMTKISNQAVIQKYN